MDMSEGIKAAVDFIEDEAAARLVVRFDVRHLHHRHHERTYCGEDVVAG